MPVQQIRCDRCSWENCVGCLRASRSVIVCAWLAEHCGRDINCPVTFPIESLLCQSVPVLSYGVWWLYLSCWHEGGCWLRAWFTWVDIKQSATQPAKQTLSQKTWSNLTSQDRRDVGCIKGDWHHMGCISWKDKALCRFSFA